MAITHTGYRRAQLARLAGVGVETLRFYENKGLLEPPERDASNYRVYSDLALDRMRFIQRCRGAGFSLDEIGEFLGLISGPTTRCLDVCDFVDDKVARLDDQIRVLADTRDMLKSLTDECRSLGEKSLKECRVLNHLESASCCD